MESLSRLSWKARGTGSISRAEVGQTLRGYRISKKNRSPFLSPAPEEETPVVTWISFDGDTYWVGLSTADGWPRTIRVTQNDVEGAKSIPEDDDI